MNQKGFINIILAILFVAVVSVAGYAVFIKKSVTTEQSQPSAQNPSAPQSAVPRETAESAGVFGGTRDRALNFIKNHSNIYDTTWKWEGFSYQNYTNLPDKGKLSYQWFTSNESETIKDEKGDMVVRWTGLPGCTKAGSVYKNEGSGTRCYSLLEFSVHFDSSATPMYIRVIDIGGTE